MVSWLIWFTGRELDADTEATFCKIIGFFASEITFGNFLIRYLFLTFCLRELCFARIRDFYEFWSLFISRDNIHTSIRFIIFSVLSQTSLKKWKLCTKVNNTKFLQNITNIYTFCHVFQCMKSKKGLFFSDSELTFVLFYVSEHLSRKKMRNENIRSYRTLWIKY